MFIDENKDSSVEMVRIAQKIQPDEVQRNTPLRACVVKPLSPVELKGIEEQFLGLKVSSVYEKIRRWGIKWPLDEIVVALHFASILCRRW